MLGAMVAVVVEHYWAYPGFRAFMFGTYAPHEMEIITQRLMRPLILRFSTIMRRDLTDMPECEAELHAEVMLYAMSRILLVTTRLKDAKARDLMFQKQQMILMKLSRLMLGGQ